jgi:hypothetical protein
MEQYRFLVFSSGTRASKQVQSETGNGQRLQGDTGNGQGTRGTMGDLSRVKRQRERSTRLGGLVLVRIRMSGFLAEVFEVCVDDREVLVKPFNVVLG